ncbi:hypothetical protein KFE96_09570 [Kordiimonas sp. SCSIO 12603]|uniref:hypothetical protein n=1 Tax=Kordiimonas sp. SCSIO 12603 TaxID=2829596 RepID=UPI002102DAD2|nr:hypothetical protein [Kordiimonas sp. SCSIO 12603]UTW57115.1 hypothetical protein KFE96_09570 [Kordiimonas sp. SCSIO 12603]
MEELEEKLLKLEIDEKERDLKDRDKPRSKASHVNDFLKTASSVIALIAGSVALWQQMENSQKQTEIKDSQTSITSTQQRLDKTQSEIEARQKLLDRNDRLSQENTRINGLWIQYTLKDKNIQCSAIPVPRVDIETKDEITMNLWDNYAGCLAYFESNDKPGKVKGNALHFDFQKNVTNKARFKCLSSAEVGLNYCKAVSK